ncbi:MAG: hypothetical protein AB1407_09405 [Spirochaetota bacterium]
MRIRPAAAALLALVFGIFPLSAQFCPTSNDAWYPPFSLAQRARIGEAGEKVLESAFPRGFPPLAATLADEHGTVWWSGYGGADEFLAFEMPAFSGAAEKLGRMLGSDGRFPGLPAFFDALDLMDTKLGKGNLLSSTPLDLAVLAMVLAMDGEFRDGQVISEAAIRKIGFTWAIEEISDSGWALAYRIDSKSRLAAVLAARTEDIQPLGGQAALGAALEALISAAQSFR